MQNIFVKNNEGDLEDLTPVNSPKTDKKGLICTKNFYRKISVDTVCCDGNTAFLAFGKHCVDMIVLYPS